MEDTLLYSLLCVFLLGFAMKFFLQARKQRKNLPPSPPALPIIGHLHLLEQPLHRTLHNLSQKYGPIIFLRFGTRPVIIVSSPEAVEECFTKNDIVLANRPPFLMAKYLNYNSTTLGAANYGDHWRNLRRLCTTEIFSSSRLSKFLDIRRDEVKNLLRRLYRVSKHGFAKVELRSMLMDLTFNMVMRMVAGKQYYGEDANEIGEARQFRELMQEFFEYTGTTILGDMFPILQWVDYDGFIKRMVGFSKKVDLFLQGLVDEHRGDKDRNTMISHLLTLQESQPEYYTDEIIKGLILAMLNGGTETSAVALEWAMCNLLNHPHVLMKAKMELETQIAQGCLIDEPDFPNLPYLQNIISENLRLCPVGPLLAPHASSHDCTIGGYDVPPGTILFVNAWAIHRDPKLWDDPTSFKPERFETGKVEAYRLLPFGLGRRACPGEVLANRVMGMTLGSLIQCFEWERVGDKEIDMTETTTITMRKTEPLVVICRPRPILNKIIS